MATQDVNIVSVAGQAAQLDPANVEKVSLSRYGITFFAQASAAKSAPGDVSADQFVQNFSELLLLINLTALSGPEVMVTFFVEIKDSFNLYYPLYTSPTFTGPGQIFESIGAGCSIPKAFGSIVRLRWAIGSGNLEGLADTSTATFAASLSGK